MKKYSLLSLLVITLFFTSCTDDTGIVQVTYQEATAIYGDMDDIRSEALIEPAREIINPGKIFIGEDMILIGEEGEGVHVINNTDRGNPVNESFLNVPGNREFFVSDNFLYAESFYDMIKIDLSNPSLPSIVARAENAIQEEFVDNNGQTLIGFSYIEKTIELTEQDEFYEEIIGDQLVYLDFGKNIIPNSAIPTSFAGNSSSQSGTVNRITKNGDYVYVISNNNMIMLNDNASDFSTSGKYSNIKTDMETIFPYNNNLFIGSRSSMTIYSLQNPSQPTELYDFDHATSCDPVLPYNNVAYITLRTADFSECPGNINALVVLDINNLSSPIEVDEIAMNSPYGMTVINNRLFVGEGTNGLKIFDVSNEKSPTLENHYKDIEAYDIIADPTNNDIIFIAGPDGLDQFEQNAAEQLELKSTIAF